MTVSDQEGPLLGPAVIVLPQRPAHPQMSPFVFLSLLLYSRELALVMERGGAVLWSDFQEEVQVAISSKGLLEEIGTYAKSFPETTCFITVEASGE